MIADYLVNRIDNLFSDKLKSHASQAYLPNKSELNRNTIKHHLPDVISKNHHPSRSPINSKNPSHSPLAKSQLKNLL